MSPKEFRVHSNSDLARVLSSLSPLLTVNKHKPWLEPTYHGIVTENDNRVLLDPPLVALDKDAPLRFAGTEVALSRCADVDRASTSCPHLYF